MAAECPDHCAEDACVYKGTTGTFKCNSCVDGFVPSRGGDMCGKLGLFTGRLAALFRFAQEETWVHIPGQEFLSIAACAWICTPQFQLAVT